MSTIVINTYSDHDMQCPGSWENGFKEARVKRFGDGERTLSQFRTGDWIGSTFTLQISDYDRSIRQRLNSPTDRFWSEALTVKMTDRPTRAALDVPYTVFVGPIIEARPTSQLGFDLTLGDIISQSILSDQTQVPWRRVGDGFLSQLTGRAEGLDLDAAEPIIYGINTRLPDDGGSPSAAVGVGLVVPPVYLGIQDVSGTPYHVWMLAGHACAGCPDLYVDKVSDIANEGVWWLVPHNAGWTAEFTVPYRDLRSDIFENDRRYTLIYGVVGQAVPDACASGEKSLTVAVEGIEPNANGTGVVITDRLMQYKHFAINYIANYGQRSYQSGAWLSNPTWTLFDGTVEIVDEDSFDAASEIAFTRLYDGYIGAAVILDRRGARHWIAEWNRSCAARFGISHLGQMRIVMLSPTDAIKAAAPLFDDVQDVLQGSFGTDVLWREHANRIPFRVDFDHVTGQFWTTDVAADATSVDAYGRDIPGESRDYLFAPGITHGNHLAVLELRIARYPPRVVTFETSLGALATMDLGDYIRYRHFDSVSGSSTEIRLAQIQRHQVQAGKRRVLVEALDVEDYIDYDTEPISEPSTNVSCADAIAMATFVEGEAQNWILDTTTNATDDSVEGLFGDGSPPSPGIAYHAAWWKFTPDGNGFVYLLTAGSNYDTQLAVFTGTCGGSPPDWTQEAYNDNQGLSMQAGLVIAVVAAQEYYVLVAGYGPDDSGELHLQSEFLSA